MEPGFRRQLDFSLTRSQGSDNVLKFSSSCKSWHLNDNEWIDPFHGFIEVFVMEEILDLRLSITNDAEQKRCFRLVADHHKPIRSKTEKAYALKVQRMNDGLFGSSCREARTLALKFKIEAQAKSFKTHVDQFLNSLITGQSFSPSSLGNDNHQKSDHLEPVQNHNSRSSANSFPNIPVTPDPSTNKIRRSDSGFQNWGGDPWICDMCCSRNPGGTSQCEVCMKWRTSLLRTSFAESPQTGLAGFIGKDYGHAQTQMSSSFVEQFQLDDIDDLPEVPGDPVGKGRSQGDSLAGEMWRCQVCTYDNQSFVRACDMCHVDRPDLEKFLERMESNNNLSNQNSQSASLNLQGLQELDSLELDPEHQAWEEPTEHNFLQVTRILAFGDFVNDQLFETLLVITEKLYKRQLKYRMLDTRFERVAELLGHEGVLEFLELLGFRGDETGGRVRIQDVSIPPDHVVDMALKALTEQRQQFESMKAMENLESQVSMTTHISQDAEDYDPEFEEQLKEVQKATANEWNMRQMLDLVTHESISDDEQGNSMAQIISLCFHSFSSSTVFLKGLRERFFSDDGNPEAKRKRGHKVGAIVKFWINNFFLEDFLNELGLQEAMEAFAHEMREQPEEWARVLGDNVLRMLNYKRENVSLDMPIRLPPGLAGADTSVDLMGLDPSVLAEQLCIIDHRLFKNIRQRELVNQNWKRDEKEVLSPNVLALIAQFNKLTVWIQVEILLEQNLTSRIEVMEKLLDLCEACIQKRNYSSANALYAGFSADPIYKLKVARGGMSESAQNLYTKFQMLFSPRNGFRALRNELNRASQSTTSVPHIGIFLQDLFNIDEGKEKHISFGGQTRALNYSKYSRTRERIHFMKGFGREPFEFAENFDIQASLFKKFQVNQSYDRKTLYRISMAVRDKDADEDANSGFFDKFFGMRSKTTHRKS